MFLDPSQFYWIHVIYGSIYIILFKNSLLVILTFYLRIEKIIYTNFMLVVFCPFWFVCVSHLFSFFFFSMKKFCKKKEEKRKKKFSRFGQKEQGKIKKLLFENFFLLFKRSQNKINEKKSFQDSSRTIFFFENFFHNFFSISQKKNPLS